MPWSQLLNNISKWGTGVLSYYIFVKYIWVPKCLSTADSTAPAKSIVSDLLNVGVENYPEAGSHRGTLRWSGIYYLSSACPAYIPDLGLFITMSAKCPSSNGASPSANKMTVKILDYQWSICTSWWRHQMETQSALLAICAGNSSVTGEFPTQRPVTQSFDVLFGLRRNKRLSTKSWGWWFETLSRPGWRKRNVLIRWRQSNRPKCPAALQELVFQYHTYP